MSINIPRLIHEYFAEHMGSDRKSDRAIKYPTDNTKAEFDTDGVQRHRSGDERRHQNPTGESRDNI
jgi:hypothetical protein